MVTTMKVIPMRPGPSMTKQQREIVDLAFAYWLERFGIRDGSPEEDLFRAQREVLTTRSSSSSTGKGPFLISKFRA